MGSNPITAIADGSILTVPICKQHLRVDGTDEDFIIGLYLQAAWERADAYCNNPFLDANGRPRDIPAPCELWCLQFVSYAYENRTAGISKSQIQDLGSNSFSKQSDVDINYNLLKEFRVEPGLSSFW